MRREASGVFSYLSKPSEQLSCLHTLTVATDTEVTAKAVGSVPGHSKFGGMPELAGLVLEQAQFRLHQGSFWLASNAGSYPRLAMAQTQIPS